jgi:hypothetical protein
MAAGGTVVVDFVAAEVDGSEDVLLRCEVGVPLEALTDATATLRQREGIVSADLHTDGEQVRGWQRRRSQALNGLPREVD